MPLKTHLDEQPKLNLTPMIDIVFLLIIFFMVGTTFVSQQERKIPLEVPEVSDTGALTAPPENRVVNVYRDGSIALDREAVTLPQLTERLKVARSQYSQLGVVVRGDAQAVHQNVTEVLNACRQAGITELGISVKLNRVRR